MTEKYNKIFLVGFMAAGKTTLGKKIANTLNYDFIDIDNYISHKYNKSVTSIFEEEGESFFRELEKNTLDDFNILSNKVVSTGGGTPCYFDNIEKIRKMGFSIFINTPIYIIISRLINKPNNRPLLKNLTIEQIPDFVKNLYHKRVNIYKKCHLSFNPIQDDYEKLISVIRNNVV